MTLAPVDNDYPGCWRAIKSGFTRSLAKDGVNIIKNEKGEYNLWQRRYWEHEIQDELDMQRQVDYIHFNPVKHNHVQRVVDWPHSSFHRYVRLGVLREDWGSEFFEKEAMTYGE